MKDIDNQSMRPRERLAAGQAAMTAHDFVNRQEKHVSDDLRADPSLFDDLILAGGAGSTQEYRAKLVKLWPLAIAQRPDRILEYLGACAVGSTFRSMTEIFEKTIATPKSQSDREKGIRTACAHMRIAVDSGKQSQKEVDGILKSVLMALIQESLRQNMGYGREGDFHLSINMLTEEHGESVRNIINKDSIAMMSGDLHWIGEESAAIADIARENMRSTFNSLVALGAGFDSELFFTRDEAPARYTDTIEGPILLATAWHLRQGMVRGELANLMVEAGADWKGLLTDPALTREDLDTLRKVPAIRRELLSQNKKEDHENTCRKI